MGFCKTTENLLTKKNVSFGNIKDLILSVIQKFLEGKQCSACIKLWGFIFRRIARDFESPPSSPTKKDETPEPGARLFSDDVEHPYRSVDGAVTEQYATPYKEPLQADT